GERFRVSAEDAPQVLSRAETLGVLVAAGEGRYEVPSPSLLAVAEQVVARGVSLNEALSVFKQVELHCDAVSGAFVSLFMREVWEPFEAAGMPPERWAEIDETVAGLRPLATEALVSIFGHRMSAQIDTAFGQRMKRLEQGGRPRRCADGGCPSRWRWSNRWSSGRASGCSSWPPGPVTPASWPPSSCGPGERSSPPTAPSR